MKIKKYAVAATIVGITLTSGIVISSANYNAAEIKNNNEYIKQSFDKLVSSDAIEHVRLTYDNGEFVDMFRDTVNLLDQTDYYDSNGKLLSRILVLNNGKEAISIGEDNGVYSGVRLKLTDDLSDGNKEILKDSMIESYFTKDVESGLDMNWQLAESNDENILKYTSKNNNVYINKETKELIKREILANGKVYQTIEYNLVNRNGRSGQSLFRIDSPLSSKSRSTIDLKSIEIKDTKSEPDTLLENSKG